MDIRILQLIDGAKKAVGLTVIIDVFRAFSVACYAFHNGAAKMMPVGEMAMAYRLKEENPSYILMGERDCKIQPGFDYGNSPTQIKDVDFSGKTIVHTTSAGTQGIANATGAEEMLTGSLVNAGAIIGYIQKKKPSVISLVCMGYAGIEPAAEDTSCAEYIKSALEGTHYDMASAIEKMKRGSGRRFFDKANSGSCPESDFYLCTELDKFNFVLKAEKVKPGVFALVKENL